MHLSSGLKQFVVVTGSLLLAAFVLFYSLWRLNLSMLGPRDASIDAAPMGQRLSELCSPPILPDHPLYMIGMISDRLDLLLASPQQRFNLKLKLADTRLATAQILVGRKRPNMALTTLTKAEKYIISAAEDLPNLDASVQKDAGSKLSDTINTHVQILNTMKPSFDGPGQATIDNLIEQILVRSPAR